MKSQSISYLPSRVLKLNVGFLLDGQNSQQSKDMELDLPAVRVAEDLEATYVRGKLRVSRTKEGLVILGKLSVGVDGECYRCLEPVERAIVVDVQELFATSDELSIEEAEFHVHEDGQLDLAPLLRAEVLIQMTRGVRCQDRDACTERMRRLEEDADIDHIDPRMAKLRELLNSQQDET